MNNEKESSLTFNNYFELSKELNKSNLSEFNEKEFDKLFNKKTTELSEMIYKIEEFQKTIEQIEESHKTFKGMLTEVEVLKEIHEENCSEVNEAIYKISRLCKDTEDRLYSLSAKNLILFEKLNEQYKEINSSYENIKDKNIQHQEQMSKFEAISRDYDEILNKISKVLPVMDEMENKYSMHSKNFITEKLIISMSVVLSIFFFGVLIIFIMLHN